MLTRLGWWLTASSALCAVVDTVVLTMSAALLSETAVAVHGWPLMNLAALNSSVMGALIIARSPRQPVGWLMTGIGTTVSVSLLLDSLSTSSAVGGGAASSAAGQVLGVLAALLGGPTAMAGLTLVLLLVPDGHFLSRGWRHVGTAAAVGLALVAVGILVSPPEEVVKTYGVARRGAVADALLDTGALVVVGALVAAAACLVVRLRGARGDARLQLRWIAAAAAVVGVTVTAGVLGQVVVGGPQTWSTTLPAFAAYFVLTVAIGIAMLRYRLYDIDLIISRAVLFGAGTLFAGCGYIALVVGVGALLRVRSDSLWPSLLATAAVAVAFQPLRRSVVRLADRLAYGPRAAPYAALSELTRRAGQHPAADDLMPALAESTGRALGAGSATVRLTVPEGPDRGATWRTAASADETARVRAVTASATVADEDGELGSIVVSWPPAWTVRPQEQRLLDDLAGHAALAFRTSRLETQLADSVEALSQQTAELAASRHRLLEAGDTARRRVAATIVDEVVPTLLDLQARLVLASDAASPVASTDGLVEQATEALEALRRLTQGLFPTLLVRAGVGPALAAHLRRRTPPGSLDVEESAARRLPVRVEMTAYACYLQVSGGEGPLEVHVEVLDGVLRLDLRGPDIGVDDRDAVRDRVEASGGQVHLVAPGPSGGGLTVLLPVQEDPVVSRAAQRPGADLQTEASRSGPKTPLRT